METGSFKVETLLQTRSVVELMFMSNKCKSLVISFIFSVSFSVLVRFNYQSTSALLEAFPQNQ